MRAWLQIPYTSPVSTGRNEDSQHGDFSGFPSWRDELADEGLKSFLRSVEMPKLVLRPTMHDFDRAGIAGRPFLDA